MRAGHSGHSETAKPMLMKETESLFANGPVLLVEVAT